MGVATKAPVSISTPNSGRLGSLLRVGGVRGLTAQARGDLATRSE
jgi:hypothetical protein